MPGYVLIADVFAAILAFAGFTMAFRQSTVRRLIGRSPPVSSIAPADGEVDPITYILRIAGVMLMVFGIAIGGMFTLFHAA
ncbi:hypothetical protein [Novosphingobium album (ex Liu et al. 2023)]|uniref:Uncharacterized protein n=1 Tax=Novosphingobium album (ex Liu et al. 2023) TaxID=3031130 RepID=A0ABT5WWM6_9SPHN|nr:hypothetical protein [Novosphingobium album (ex Liu et al. 2023)]MDE8654254.1 hypothetical protein [Novosphingobium album (ex Liu et al. 2023)]